jgi:cold shock CspA family protein
MGRSQESFNKKNVRAKKEKKRKEKEQKKALRKEDSKSGDLDSMIAYVDEYGRIVDEPVDPDKREEVVAEDIELGATSKEIPEEDGLKNGVVDYFNESKGFGFIKENTTNNNFFVHVFDVEGELNIGDHVTFEIGSGQKGPAAKNVKVIKK